MAVLGSSFLCLLCLVVSIGPWIPDASAGDEVGACCLADGRCVIREGVDCYGPGEDYRGDGSTCDPNPCRTGACCDRTSGLCEILTPIGCADTGDGLFEGYDIPCDPNPCAGACCHPDDGRCILQHEFECGNMGWEFLGDFTLCEPNPCGPVPSVEESWGVIKQVYR